MDKALLAGGKISPEDINLFRIIDEPDEIVNFTKNNQPHD